MAQSAALPAGHLRVFLNALVPLQSWVTDKEPGSAARQPGCWCVTAFWGRVISFLVCAMGIVCRTLGRVGNRTGGEHRGSWLAAGLQVLAALWMEGPAWGRGVGRGPPADLRGAVSGVGRPPWQSLPRAQLPVVL